MFTLQGEKAYAEREVKRLNSQKTLLERDISKRDSVAGRKRDSVVDWSSMVHDPRKQKGFSLALEQMQVKIKGSLYFLTFYSVCTMYS